MKKLLFLTFAGLLLFSGLVCCSGLHFPFFNARRSLNAKLNSDFGMALPPGARVVESHWVGYRDSEHVFKIEMAPSDIGPFIESLRAAGANARGFKPDADVGSSVRGDTFGPLYRRPQWWNHPPLKDPMGMEILIGSGPTPSSHYRFLYSPSTGTTYVVWGGF